MYIENYKIWLKEIKGMNKWKYIPRSWIRRVSIVKVTVLSKAICRLSAVFIKISSAFLQK